MRSVPWSQSLTKLAMVVDESSEMLCENANKRTDFTGHEVDTTKSDRCLLTDFQMLFRSKFYFQCIKISMFYKSIHWYQKLRYTSMSVKEIIWLQEQKNPYAFGSGFMNVKDPLYSEYLKAFRQVFFHGYCRYCPQYNHEHQHHQLQQLQEQKQHGGPGLNSAHENGLTPTPMTKFGYKNPHNLVILLKREINTGRHILQHNELEDALRLMVENINSVNETQLTGSSSSSKSYNRFSTQSHNPRNGSKMAPDLSVGLQPVYQLVQYTGEESLCQTISMFWSAKVVIAAHGAGIVNTVFSRPGSLLVEITPDKLNPLEKGQPWRVNAPFATSVGLRTHVLVVPHNSSARSDKDIQKYSALDLTRAHISTVVDIVSAFLRESHTSNERDVAESVSMNITVMVS